MIASLLAVALFAGACDLYVGIGNHGELYSSRFHGWYRTSVATLRQDVQGGCYNDGHGAAVSSVRVFVARKASVGQLESTLKLLEEKGVLRDRVSVVEWKTYPQEP